MAKRELLKEKTAKTWHLFYTNVYGIIIKSVNGIIESSYYLAGLKEASIASEMAELGSFLPASQV